MDDTFKSTDSFLDGILVMLASRIRPSNAAIITIALKNYRNARASGDYVESDHARNIFKGSGIAFVEKPGQINWRIEQHGHRRHAHSPRLRQGDGDDLN